MIFYLMLAYAIFGIGVAFYEYAEYMAVVSPYSQQYRSSPFLVRLKAGMIRQGYKKTIKGVVAYSVLWPLAIKDRIASKRNI